MLTLRTKLFYLEKTKRQKDCNDMEKILIVEDDIAFGTMIQTWLRKKGFEVEKTTSVKAAIQAWEKLESGFDLVLSDLRLPDHDGIFLLQWMRKHGMQVPFIVMTSYAEIQNVVLAMKSGATDYVAKPFHPDILLEKIKEAIKNHNTSSLSEKNIEQREATGNQEPIDNKKVSGNMESKGNVDVPKYLEGESEASRKLYSFVSLVAPTPMSVLILGASGTGKEYVARRIHELSQRAGKPFFALDCGAIPKDVAASEFFGHSKGAFTGADQDKKGAFEIANGGTLFLDEMGNLNYEVQVQLLRALQERKIRPLGSNKEIDIDIRLVCATNENLAQRVAEGNFREDLYHRINEFTIYMPELKDRGADLFLFADLFIKHANKELNRNVEGLDGKAKERIASYNWPGNLRELNNVMKRATLLATGRYIGVTELEQSMAHIQPQAPTTLHDEETELQRIEAALKAAGGNKSKAAQLLAVDRKTLYNKMKKYGI
jgi:two-component system, NtrC family, response regulator HydG